MHKFWSQWSSQIDVMLALSPGCRMVRWPAVMWWPLPTSTAGSVILRGQSAHWVFVTSAEAVAWSQGCNEGTGCRRCGFFLPPDGRLLTTPVSGCLTLICLLSFSLSCSSGAVTTPSVQGLHFKAEEQNRTMCSLYGIQRMIFFFLGRISTDIND